MRLHYISIKVHEFILRHKNERLERGGGEETETIPEARLGAKLCRPSTILFIRLTITPRRRFIADFNRVAGKFIAPPFPFALEITPTTTAV